MTNTTTVQEVTKPASYSADLTRSVAYGAIGGLAGGMVFGMMMSMLGIGYGIFWWILGALVLMPTKLGMPIFAINTVAWQSLMGHMVFGLVMGAVAVALARQSSKG